MTDVLIDMLCREVKGCRALATDTTDTAEGRLAARRAVLIERLIEDLEDLDENGY